MKPLLKLIGTVLLLLLAPGPGLAADEPAKLAVLPTMTEFAPMADLLTAELSTLGGVAMLEREQIQKVFREQQLAAGQRPDFVKLGRLLNADGLLSLERATDGTNEVLAVRLLAVKPGVVAAEHRFALPLSAPADWGKSFALRIERLLPKLTVKPEEAVAISVLPLRSAVATPEGMALEQELTALLQFRLAREPSLFLLERRRMDELQTEKQMESSEPEPFWNGAHVLDGTINRDTVSRETVTIHARLVPPRGTAVSLAVSGHRAALGTVVDELAGKILIALNKSPKSESWQPAAEAERFFQEAVWAWTWQLWGSAAESADASWALGRHTRLVAAYRVISRAWVALGMRGPLSYQGTPPYGFRPPPLPEALPILARTMEIYREAFEEFQSETNGPGTAWASVGLDVLMVTSRLLDRFQENVEFCQGHETELRQVRELAREVNWLLTTNRSLGPTRWQRNHEGLPIVHVNFASRTSLRGLGTRARLCEIWMDAGGTWFESPSEALALYRTLLTPDHYPLARASFLDGPPLAAWTAKDRAQLSVVRAQFLREMAASTNAQIRFDGLRFQLEHSIDPEELALTARRLTDEAWVAREAIFLREIDVPVAPLLSNLVRRVESWGQPSADLLRSLSEQWDLRWTNAAPDLSYAAWKQMLTIITNPATRNWDFSKVPRVAPREAQVRELAAQLEAAHQRHGFRIQAQQFLKLLRISAGVTNEARGATQGDVAATNSPGQAAAGSLAIRQRWSLEDAPAPEGRMMGWNPRARNPVWQNGRIWMETETWRRQDDVRGIRPAVVALDPRTMRAELFEVPFDSLTHREAPRRSLVVESNLYFCADDALWRRDAHGDWRRLPVPLSEWAMPYRWGQRVVLSAEGSILELDPLTERVRILASTRRNPPVTALDRAGALNKATLAVWPGDRLCASVGGEVWAYDAARQDWKAFISATNCGELLELHPDGVFYRQSGECGFPLLGGWRPGSSRLEFYELSAGRFGGRQALAPAFTPPRWIAPGGFHPLESKVAFVGADVWVFPAAAHRYASAAPRSLLWLDRRFMQARSLRLELTGPVADLEQRFDQERGQPGHVEFLPTPEGLAIVMREGGTVLWVPQSDLDRALEEAARKNPLPERQDLAALRRSDRDQNGWLDDVERRAMRLDLGWSKEQQVAREAAILRHGTEWDRLFKTVDKNSDGKLSSFELASAATTLPEVFTERLRGVNTGFGPAMRPFDLNNDMGFDRAEFKAFLAEPRLLAEINQSAEWVTKFGLKLEQCDPNDDGLLDGNERKQVNRLIRQRLGGGTNEN